MTGNTRRREAEDSSLFPVTEIRAGRRLREDRDSGGSQVAGARKKEPASLVHFALLLLVLPLSLWVHCFLPGASDGSWKASLARAPHFLLKADHQAYDTALKLQDF